MYSFRNDYSEIAHPKILDALISSNLIQSDGYGEDKYTKEAIKLLKYKLQGNNIDIHFLVGGTQTNLVAISAFLRPYEAAIAANTGHILSHETGAIEATGHKIISVKSENGKLNPENIQSVLDKHTDEHTVKPKLVYISNSTEIGSIYTKEDLKALNTFCRNKNLILYMDGARLGSALCSNKNDIEFSDLTKLLDAFYIGGTKNGALIGEALVICKDSLKENFRFNIKQKGALLAKGQILGLQFLELFKDNLYFTLAAHANNMAYILHDAIKEEGFSFFSDSYTNQIFPIMPDKIINKLQKKYAFNILDKIDKDTSIIRLVTSWATDKDKVSEFICDLKESRI